MPRPRTGIQRRGERIERHPFVRCGLPGQRLAWCERALSRIELVDQNAIQSKVRNIDQMIVRRGLNPVRVRRFLALFVRTCDALVVHERRVFSEPAIRQNRENRNRPRTVVGNENVLAGFVERQITRILAERRNLIQQCKLSSLRIHRKSAHGACFARFIRGIQKFSIPVHRYPRRVRRLRGNAIGR